MKVWEEFLKLDGWRSGYSSVDKALRHYARKSHSEGTRENFCVTLMQFCKHCCLDPDAFVALEPAEASRLCQNYTDSLNEREYSIRYVNVSQAYLRTFFGENGYEMERSLKVERYHQPARYRKKPEYVPDAEEIYRMGYAAGSAKNRAMVFMLHSSGLRNSTLRAVLYGDVRKELESGLKIVKVPVYPEMKKIDPDACKGEIPYYTFVHEETVKALNEYLIERKGTFGNVADDEPLFCSDSNMVARERQPHTPVSKNGLDRMVKGSARRAGIERWRDVTPKSLRKAFESSLRNNRLDPKDQEFLMGHILPGIQDPYYDSSKTEDLKAKYSAVKFFKTETDKLEMVKAFAQSLGIGNIEVKVQKLREQHSGLDEMEALGRVMRQELGIKPLEIKMARRREDGDCDNHMKYESKIIEEKKLLSHIEDGWEIIKELKNGKLAIRRELV